MPLIRRVPKRGFTNVFKKRVDTVNIRDLDVFAEGTIVTPALLVERGRISKNHEVVKILGTGELNKKLVVKAHAFSSGARKKIEEAGGSAEEIKE